MARSDLPGVTRTCWALLQLRLCKWSGGGSHDFLRPYKRTAHDGGPQGAGHSGVAAGTYLRLFFI